MKKVALDLWKSLLGLMSNELGEGEVETKIIIPDDETDLDSDEGDSEGDGEDSGEDDEDEDGEDDGDADSGTNSNNSRSKTVPRKRFDQVNAKAQKVEALLESGVLVEGEDGEIQVNPDTVDRRKGSKSDSGDFEFMLKEDDVDKASWPIAQKINNGFTHFNKMAGQLNFVIRSLQSENAILRDYPEFLQKESPLRKKVISILKDDPEFKKKYKNDPEKGYWAAKRAYELLNGGKTTKPTKKPKSKFITGKGDSGKTGVKSVKISDLSSEQLDELERKEHDSLLTTSKK